MEHNIYSVHVHLINDIFKNMITKQMPQMSIGFGTGFLMCLMVEPGWEGLKGARAPYGFGRGRSISPCGR